MGNIHNESRNLEIREGADVIVLGGGPGGISAAVAAARHGMNVMIVEKNIILGGLATAGHVCLFEPLCDGKGRKVTSGIAEEMLHLSIAYSYNTLPKHWSKKIDYVKNPEDIPGELADYMDVKGRYCTLFNVPAFILALEEWVLKEKITILYDTLFSEPVMDGDSCVGVIVENLSGRYMLKCKVLVDGTGFSTAFHRAGAECATYNNRFTFECFDTDFDMMKKAIETGDMAKAIHWRLLGWHPLHSDPKERSDLYGLTVEDINTYVRMSHKVALDYLKNNKNPGYTILSLPTMPQIRMTRRIKGKYEMCPEDVFKKMDDSVGCVSDWRKSGPIYEIPYSCMLIPKFKNMIAVGRNLSAQDDTWDVMRCYPGAISTGQAGGTAAALAIHNGVSLNEVNIRNLQEALDKDGVILHQ